MTRTWDANWNDVVDASNPKYVACMRRMILASVNWMEAHSAPDLQWDEIDKEKWLEEHGVVLPQGVTPDQVWISAAWEHLIEPVSEDAKSWLAAIVEAACEGDPAQAPSYMMMAKAMACGILFKDQGWDAFNRFMLLGDRTVH